MSAKPENERHRIATECMVWRMDSDGDWPREKAIEALAYIDKPHSGDCTNQSWTCLRCEAEAAYKQADAIIAQRDSGGAEPVAWLGVCEDGNVSVTTEADSAERWAKLGRSITPLGPINSRPAEAQARVEALEAALREMVGAFASWAGKTVNQEDAVHKAMLALLSPDLEV